MRGEIILTVFLLLCLSVLSMADTRGKIDVKVDEEIYACNMPESCPCDTLAMKPGKCKCGVELIKTKVTKVDDDAIYVESRGRGFKRVGKYACGCGETCNCGTISLKLGRCVCGIEMKEVKGGL
jgi:hypothetical protein